MRWCFFFPGATAPSDQSAVRAAFIARVTQNHQSGAQGVAASTSEAH